MITFEIDELTSCLKDSITGENLETEVIELKRKSLLSKFNSRNGWYVNWGGFPDGVRIFALVLKGTFDIQGLIAIEPDYEASAVHIVWACTAPQNNIWRYGIQKYIGVGGHLFALAIQRSLECGFGGHIYGYAKNEAAKDRFINNHGAVYIGVLHPFHIEISGIAARKIWREYNYDFFKEKT